MIDPLEAIIGAFPRLSRLPAPETLKPQKDSPAMYLAGSSYISRDQNEPPGTHTRAHGSEALTTYDTSVLPFPDMENEALIHPTPQRSP